MDCERGNGRSCSRLGVLLQAGQAAPGQLVRGTAVLQARCVGGLGAACVQLGELFEQGRGVTRDPARATELRKNAASLFELACTNGQASACMDAAELHELGRGVARDAAFSTALLQRACAKGEELACHYARRLGRGRREASYTLDLDRPPVLAREACLDGHPLGCVLLGSFYETGIDGRQDEVKASEFYRQGCEKGLLWGCDKLGFSYEFRSSRSAPLRSSPPSSSRARR
jgi:uncharacterized protein